MYLNPMKIETKCIFYNLFASTKSEIVIAMDFMQTPENC